MPVCFESMPDPFTRAEDWRARAIELRLLADSMGEPTARQSVLNVADGLDVHARHLEEMAVKIRCVVHLRTDPRARQAVLGRLAS